MPVQSAGLLMCRTRSGTLEYFLIHPGGPYFSKKNEGFWTIPKGLLETGENPQTAALREFAEETGIKPTPPFYSLGAEKMKSGKLLHVWFFLGEWDEASGITSNYIDIEWPPRSGKTLSIPEADRAEWMIYDKAVSMINSGQRTFLEKARDLYSNGAQTYFSVT